MQFVRLIENNEKITRVKMGNKCDALIALANSLVGGNIIWFA
jgi:hypothetical protein